MNLISQIARQVDWYQRQKGTQWADVAEENIHRIEREGLPHGSGFDVGCTVDLYQSDGRDKVVIVSSYHAMDETGSYIGWVDIFVTITPSLRFGFDLDIEMTGDDYEGDMEEFEMMNSDYFYDVFNHDLSADAIDLEKPIA